ncbi:MAG: 1,4-dihydroxy-6-naphthoate synthase [Parvibaculum sp.]|uniref:menaquinone biosynthesis family protein n=1 Tax=Parvibaculum sp. TaxID=2024848 RepID=UPI00272FB82B|nr:1,4-dihydroxy-6-naphthoate synthase [Parvibaculum sp.]MDP2151619.1 1,4-dihydroxy-6-naphthoate synthase [Parvibaculum sp.]
MRELTLGYSPCPNDTFIFYGLVHGKVDTGGLRFREALLDVEALNRTATSAGLDITKVSYSAFAGLREQYCLLRSGGAMGRGCGPLVVAKEVTTMEKLRGKTIAIPGEMTTAYLLLRLYDMAFSENIKVMRFDEIMNAVKNKEADAGLIIHESRLTYPAFGLKPVLDLGRWWADKTGLPIPLGAIIAKRTLGRELINRADALIKESVLYAMSNRQETEAYIKAHSRELEDSVIREHIGLYVNDFSVDIGEEGIEAVGVLFEMAEAAGIAKRSAESLFIGD